MYMKYFVNYKKFISGNAIPKITKANMINININIPSIQDQEKIIKEIEKIESEQSSYAEYAKMLQTQIDSISNLVTNITKTNKETEKKTENNIQDEEDNETDESEEEPEYETVEHKGKKYYLDGKKVYRINKDKSLGELYGKYKNGEVIKLDSEPKKEDKKVIVKAKK